jgi:hypothetical protein
MTIIVHLCEPDREIEIDGSGPFEQFCGRIREITASGATSGLPMPPVPLMLQSMNGQELSHKNFGEVVAGQHVICFTHEGQRLRRAIKLEVAITPHINILIHGGDGYDFPSAIAELIDNSISATMDNRSGGGRLIDINFTPSVGSDGPTLTVRDNGRGMDINMLQSWATLGMTESPHCNAPNEGPNSIYRTSAFSRYGVGSKKAIFNLGCAVKVVSKKSGSRFCYEAVLSKEQFKEQQQTSRSGSAQWRTTLSMREAGPGEANESHFTTLTISGAFAASSIRLLLLLRPPPPAASSCHSFFLCSLNLRSEANIYGQLQLRSPAKTALRDILLLRVCGQQQREESTAINWTTASRGGGGAGRG